MQGKLQDTSVGSLTPLNRIRVDTALSRFPIHRLAKRGDIHISFKTISETGEIDVLWDVSHNSRHGQPGPTAYKLDTLVINRRIDESPRPLPEVIKLGSLNAIIKELGNVSAGDNTKSVKAALHQNASTYITAKIRYKTKSGGEKWAEIGYTRYSVVFTGEVLPNGETADSVYIVLNASYRELLNQSEVRPLDYHYLLELPPGPQRLYELLSSKMYGALANRRPSARLVYSEYCLHAPQTRYFDRSTMQKQMYKVHLPHIKPEADGHGQINNYIQNVEYRPTKDRDGKQDWEILYTPGPRAYREYEAFARKTVTGEVRSTPLLSKPAQQALDLGVDSSPIAIMARLGISPAKAKSLLAKVDPGQDVMDQLEYVEYCVNYAQAGKIRNPAGFCINFIEDHTPVPADFITTRKRRAHAQELAVKESELLRMTELHAAYDEYADREVVRYIADLSLDEYERRIVAEIQEYKGRFKQMTTAQLRANAENALRVKLKHTVPPLKFEEFCRQQ